MYHGREEDVLAECPLDYSAPSMSYHRRRRRRRFLFFLLIPLWCASGTKRNPRWSISRGRHIFTSISLMSLPLASGKREEEVTATAWRVGRESGPIKVTDLMLLLLLLSRKELRKTEREKKGKCRIDGWDVEHCRATGYGLILQLS